MVYPSAPYERICTTFHSFFSSFVYPGLDFLLATQWVFQEKQRTFTLPLYLVYVLGSSGPSCFNTFMICMYFLWFVCFWCVCLFCFVLFCFVLFCFLFCFVLFCFVFPIICCSFRWLDVINMKKNIQDYFREYKYK